MSLATTCVNGVCTCLLPLEANDFRPLALRHRSLAFVSALLLAVKAVTVLALAITPATAELSTITVARVVQLTNAERQKAGQSILTVNAELSAAAARKGEDMLAHDYFAHISPTGVTPWFWMQQQHYSYQIAGENLAIDFVDVEDVVAAWMASPSHHDNMLHSTYTETGVAVVTGEFQGGTSTIVVHMFGLPSGAPAAVKQPPATAGSQSKPPPTPQATPQPLPPPDTTAPRTPRIAFLRGTAPLVSRTVTVSADVEPDSTVGFMVNNKLIASTPSANKSTTLDLTEFADGELQIDAFASDAAGNMSGRSNALRLTKDTAAPGLTQSDVTFLLSPTTDEPLAMGTITQVESTAVRLQAVDGWQTIALKGPLVFPLYGGPTALALSDTVGNFSEPLSLQLLPTYAVSSETDYIDPPSRINQASRWIMTAAFIIVAILLSLAIFVRISIQRPMLIAHASLVLVLAAVFLIA